MIGEILGHAYTRGIAQRDYDDTREPIVSATGIQFNGVGENGQETFRFTIPSGGEQADSDWTSHSCLTARMPYDEIVMQVLIVLKHYLGETIIVESDGDFDTEWAAARAAVERVFGIRVTPERGELERVMN